MYILVQVNLANPTSTTVPISPVKTAVFVWTKSVDLNVLVNPALLAKNANILLTTVHQNPVRMELLVLIKLMDSLASADQAMLVFNVRQKSMNVLAILAILQEQNDALIWITSLYACAAKGIRVLSAR